MISRWANGEGLARVHQADLLLARYGGAHARSRKVLYATLGASSGDGSGEDEPSATPNAAIVKWVAVPGDIVFMHQSRAVFYEGTGRGKRRKTEPIGRYVVHRNPRGQLYLVRQRRLMYDKWHSNWSIQLQEVLGEKVDESVNTPLEHRPYPARLVRSPDPDAHWLSAISGPLEATELVTEVEDLMRPTHASNAPGSPRYTVGEWIPA